MQLSAAHKAAYERDGFLVFPELVSSAEVEWLNQRLEQLAAGPSLPNSL